MDRLRLPLRIWYMEHEPIVVRVTPPVQVKMEHKFNLALSEMNRMEHLYYGAWLAASREGKEKRTFAEFLDVVIDIESVQPDPVTASDPSPSVDSSD